MFTLHSTTLTLVLYMICTPPPTDPIKATIKTTPPNFDLFKITSKFSYHPTFCKNTCSLTKESGVGILSVTNTSKSSSEIPYFSLISCLVGGFIFYRTSGFMHERTQSGRCIKAFVRIYFLQTHK